MLSPFNPSWADRPIVAAIATVLEKRGLSAQIRKSDHMRSPKLQSAILNNLSLLKFRDMTGAGERLRMVRPDTDLESLKIALKAKSKPLTKKAARSSRPNDTGR